MASEKKSQSDLTGSPDDDAGLRPSQLSQFIGQSSLKEKLTVTIKAARLRKEPLDHVLFSGPPGLGKTTLACIIAQEMQSRLHSTSAPAITKPGDLARILTLLEEGDILFIDEIHRLNITCEEILYPAMEDGSIDFIVGEGISARSIKLTLKPFTLVGATTRSGMISSPLKARFGIDLKLEFYEISELEGIIRRSALILGLTLDEAAVYEIAVRSRMTPRAANRLLRRIRDYATVENISVITAEFATYCLARWGVDSLGLVELDRTLLSIMIDRYSGGPVGLKTIASLVNEEERTIEEDHEAYMLRIGLWEKTPQGRIVTKKAFEHMGKPWKDKTSGKTPDEPGLF
jgi:Holliday junction DNA helicase RuvB